MRGKLVRVGLVLLALGQGLPTLWAALAPRGFYLAFPTPERHWVALFPPYNEHLTRDFGIASLPFVVVLVFAAARPDRSLVRTVSLASLLFSVPHLVYHQHHVIPTSDLAAQTVSQLLPVVVALVVFALNERCAASARKGAHAAHRHA